MQPLFVALILFATGRLRCLFLWSWMLFTAPDYSRIHRIYQLPFILPIRALNSGSSLGCFPTTNHFCTDSYANECLTTLLLTVFTQRNYVADFLQAKCDFTAKTAVLRF